MGSRQECKNSEGIAACQMLGIKHYLHIVIGLEHTTVHVPKAASLL